jgi:glycosyltransferase involved in cell wall biosynthesis
MDSVTILMTTYNCSPYINQAINSILNQTHTNFELLIINDGSTDDTDEIVIDFRDNRIRYIKREHLGRAASLNFGLKNSTFDIVALMDADDISHPERLRKQVRVLNSNEKKICYTRAAFFSDSDYRIKFVSDIKIPENFSRIVALHGFFCNSTAMFYKKHILNYRAYDETLPSSEDYDLLLRLESVSSFELIPDILHFQRIKKNSLSSLMYSSQNNIIYKILEPYYTNLSASFRIVNTDEQQKLKGWREFFYGSKTLSRAYWYKINLLKWNYSMYLVFIVSMLPEKVLDYFKNQRIRLRLQYLLHKIIKFKGLEKKFRNLFREVSQI